MGVHSPGTICCRHLAKWYSHLDPLKPIVDNPFRAPLPTSLRIPWAHRHQLPKNSTLGLTRADYLEHIVRYNAQPSITREESDFLAPNQGENVPQPSITRESEFHQTSDSTSAKQPVGLPPISELELLRDRVLSELKLGKQASGYKTAQKALNRFIAELIGSV